jgi:hypothetical protein
VCGVLLAIGLWGGVPAHGQRTLPGEYEVKAAFLYNFLRFTEWPPDTLPAAGAPLVVCALGDDPFEGGLETAFQGKVVQGHPVEVRRVRTGADGRACQAVFVSASERGRLRQILESLRGSPVLTVGEVEGFARAGGIVNFVVEEGRVRFEVNPDAAARARLRLSSRVLNLARIVR